jgi:DNA helicase HerA-like ATPase
MRRETMTPEQFIVPFDADDRFAMYVAPLDKLAPVIGRCKMILGKDFSTGNDISLSTDALRRHVYIIGKSGVGKSALLEHLALTLIEEGYGVGLLDPHGDLVQKVADCMPVNRTYLLIPGSPEPFWDDFALS